MPDLFYRAFEDLRRGSRELIISRLEVYRPFVELLSRIYTKSPAVDLGCGRGEWLELLDGMGIPSVGVDLDEGMLVSCRERGYDVTRGDAIDFLKKLPDESALVVSGFHIAEHIGFSFLQELVQEALRVLKPGGILILETPNPENITVATCHFYLDPTHIKPIPPDLLAFLPTYYGYARIKVLRLQESPFLRDDNFNLTLLDVLNGASPDYSVVAQKLAAPDLLSGFDELFAKQYGIGLGRLAFRYQNQTDARFARLEQRLAKQQAELTQLRTEPAQQGTEIQVAGGVTKHIS